MAFLERRRGSSSNGHAPVVGEVLINGTPRSLTPEKLKQEANEHLDRTKKDGKPDILGLAKLHGKDVVARVTSRGTVLYIGVGIAATLTAAAIGAVVIHEHSKRK